MTVTELQGVLSHGAPEGCFLFCGEEAYLRRSYLGQLRAKVLTDPAFDTFNHIVREGADIDFPTLQTDAETPPFFAPGKLIEWHMADFTSWTDKKTDALGELCRSVGQNPGVTLVIVAAPEGFDPGTARKPSSLARKFEGMLRIINFEKSTDAQLLNWLKRHFDHEKIVVDITVLHAILDRCGHSMDVLAGETAKLVAYVRSGGRDAVTAADVAFVCSATTEADAFGLTNALLDGHAADAFAQLGDMKARRVEPTVILGQLSRLYGDLLSVSLLLSEGMNRTAIASALSLHPYKAELYARVAQKRNPDVFRRALTRLAEADITVKSSYGTDLYAMLDRLVAYLAAL